MSGVTAGIASDWWPKAPADELVYATSFEREWGMYPDDYIVSILSIVSSPAGLGFASQTIMANKAGTPAQVVGVIISGGYASPNGNPRLYTVTFGILSFRGQKLYRSEYLNVQMR